MRMRLTALALAGACGMAVAAGQARADVIYSYNIASITNFNPGAFGGTASPFTISFDLTDAAVRSGAFTLQANAGSQGSVLAEGDVGGFDYFDFSGVRVTPTSAPSGLFNLSALLGFNAAGDVTDAHISFASDVAGLETNIGSRVSTPYGTAGSTFGRDEIGTDSNLCHDPASGGMGGQCFITGGFTHTALATAPVPEPASLALVGMGVLGLGAMRRRTA